MAAQKTVQLGCCWQIGNGETARLWRDKWLPTSLSYGPVTFSHFFLDNGTVFTLNNPEIASWKLDLIHEIFLPFDVEAILSIPLSLSLLTDKLIWAPTPTGQFSVSSAYKVTRQFMLDLQHGECSTPQQLIYFWRCICKLPMPNKVKAFAWQTCRNILPTKANLFHRQVTKDNICEECGTAVESSGHLFWQCERAK